MKTKDTIKAGYQGTGSDSYRKPTNLPATGEVRKGRKQTPLCESLLAFLRGITKVEGPMTVEEIARRLGFAEPDGRGAKRAKEYLDAL